MGGNTQSIQYSVPVTSKIQGESQVYRNPSSKEGLVEGPTPQIKEMKSALLSSFQKNEKIDGLGTIIRKEGEPDRIIYKTYGEILKDVQSLGSGIINENLAYQPETENLKFVGIFSRNRVQWTVLDCACIFYKLTTIPLYDTLGDENISYVFEHTKLTTVFVNDLSLKALEKTHNLVNVKTIVCFDPFTEQQESFFKEKGVTLRTYESILNSGNQNLRDYKNEEYNVGPEDCITFCYTSGTTGAPKGAMLAQRNFCSFLAALLIQNKDVKITTDDIVLSYLPLPHVLERQVMYGVLYIGAKAVFSSGDVLKIKDDLALVRPTIFVSVPRLFSRFYEVIKKKFAQVGGLAKTALDHGLSKKLNNVSTNGGCTHKVYDPLFFNKTKAALGGRVRLMISGSAPLLPEVHKFLKVTMGCPLLEGYGQTESTGASFITRAQDPVLGHVGGPVSNIQYKLVDIPEMKYTSNDKDELGNSMPRGEIWFRGPGVFLGYYKSPERTEEALTADGWLRSGDVGAVLPSNKGLKIIDRKKNIFKLSQGEYVASQKVENAYLDCDLISEIFLHGQSSQSFAVVIIGANKKNLEELAKNLGIQGSYNEICENEKIRKEVLNKMNEIGKNKGLKGFQIAKNIYIQPNGFQSKQILTNTMKVQRHQARKAYKKQITLMYQEGMITEKK